LVTLERITSLATTLGARTVCQRSLDWASQHEIIPLVISDRSAVSALLRFADDHRLLVEPSCAAALAAVYERLAPLPRCRNVLVVVCGGAGVTFALVSKWVAQVGLQGESARRLPETVLGAGP
jgi:L-serine/L-threonine ammonia-lyase